MNRPRRILLAALLGAALGVGLPLFSISAPASTPSATSSSPASRADAIIQAASPSARGKLLGPFQPANQLEKDVLAVALLDIEAQQSYRAAMAGDPAARARRREIADLVNAYEGQYASLRETGTPFGYQWRVLSGQLQSAPVENLMPSIRTLYEARYGARDAASRQQATQALAAEQAAHDRAKAPAEAAPRAPAPTPTQCAPAADGTRFDPKDIDTTLRWWIARTQEMAKAHRSGNQLRIDAAQKSLVKQLGCLNNQRIEYTLRVQKHPIRSDPPISTAGVLAGIVHQSDRGAIRVGTERDARGVTHKDSAPILLRAGRDIDAAVLPKLSMKSTFLTSARIVKLGILGATSLRPPTLILFVTGAKAEQVMP